MEILEQVAMLTPENIHLNSFMFEPILDMSLLHLYDLYQEVKKFVDKKCSDNTMITKSLKTMWTQSEIWIFHHKSPFAHRNTPV